MAPSSKESTPLSDNTLSFHINANGGSTNSPGSDSNLSATSSTGSMKRQRRSTRLNSKNYQGKPKESIASTRKKFKRLELAHFQDIADGEASWRIGDQVEAIKWTENTREWYGARIIEVERDENDEMLVFVHYEGWPLEDADWISPTLIRAPKRPKKLQFGTTGPESAKSWSDYAAFYYSKAGEMARQNTGIVQDRRMSLHCCPCHSMETIHPERPDRIGSILQTFHINRMLRYFKRIHAQEITTEELLRAHTFGHVRNYYPLDEETVIKKEKKPLKITSIAALLNPEPSKVNRAQQLAANKAFRGVDGGTIIKADQDHINRQHRRFSTAAAFTDASQSNPQPTSPSTLVCEMTCGELGISVDTTFHPLYSSLAAKIAAGALLSLVKPIVQGQLRNGFALIRPPGHHAEDDLAMGYCIYNNVAVAVADTLEKYASAISRIAVIDCHGNGTQKIFYDNPNVLYISVHRWDNGKFYPFSGAPDECGEYQGIGKNVNIAFSEYDRKQNLAEDVCHGRLVLTLEGGYELQPLASSCAASVAQLLVPGTLPDQQIASFKDSLDNIKPNRNAIETFHSVLEQQRNYWSFPNDMSDPEFAFSLPDDWRASLSNMMSNA
ncbi:hypothetical protein [Parasitella parasitica]|uniref:histone deacetylase n=1 Tax=Parasitella parasitica TaxID=35722 RepID=A0A0B7NXL3_9FUNG|nr:hypothetical protein [Parasitella parasitica]